MYKKITANLIVENVGRTLDFYEGVLGFGLVMGVPEDSQEIVTVRDTATPLAFAIIRQGDVDLMVQSQRSLLGEPIPPAGGEVVANVCLYLEVENAKDLYHSLRNKMTIHKDLHTTFYGMEEFYLRDPNGYVLGFASPQESGA
jgi:uncharacterized glyoxalase superfamily protein PhnB